MTTLRFLIVIACCMLQICLMAQERKHIVQSGEDFVSIAEKYGINKLGIWGPLFILVGLFLLNIRNEFVFKTTELSNAIQAVGASILLVYSYYIGGGFLKHKILVFLGDISYEIFLVHSIVLLFLRCFIEDYNLYVFISFLITIQCSIFIKKIQKSLQDALRGQLC